MQVEKLAKHMGLKAPPEDKWLRSPIGALQGCTLDQVLQLRETLKPYRHVGVLSYNQFALQTHRLAGTLLLNCSSDLCCHSYRNHSVLLRHSAQRLYNTTAVFIMTHPTIRPRVARMLKAGGINAAFLDLSDLMSINMEAARPLRSPMSFSLLAIVEEAVAADARAFLGTAESSMTGMIVQLSEHPLYFVPSVPCLVHDDSCWGQERIARGLDPSDCYFFSDSSMNPNRVTDFYVRWEAEELLARSRGGASPSPPVAAVTGVNFRI
ncbi:hypothetical protein VOLCADRAFT_95915 [Volvox carteri f. nagariensis]|uniref:Uncharacterized protein n=1 Tax=Volvox carteri f. nagariensis TaxID=3068 RepID=D8U8P8_VOLCA|nr:uncharacterized protein VOLCADRAFT_95915 [Volvox carteri f. nagariensis]EFJ43786.1 hypothetical protein VOLCADRAFT_95915 [Volvox carteri f. nagariensis]|eukprot:XP_002955032.1 hypothetical protein VOLCADRAFT_95915 [Volvox carteri f. nagariensis]